MNHLGPEGRESSGSARVPTGGPQPPIPNHELLRKIAIGDAYSEVYLARDAQGDYRAVKVVGRSMFADAHDFERRFQVVQELKPLSQSHEGLADIHEIGRGESSGARFFYYAMELADPVRQQSVSEDQRTEDGGLRTGNAVWHPRIQIIPETYEPQTLRAVARQRGRLPVEESLQFGLSLASALRSLHQHGLVHGDIKPENVIFVGGIPKLANIGHGGTDAYAPADGSGTPSADLCSLGKVLYEISTGRQCDQFPDPPPELDEWPGHRTLVALNEVVLKACAQDPASRYPTADAMHADLKRLSGGQSPHSRRAH